MNFQDLKWQLYKQLYHGNKINSVLFLLYSNTNVN